MMQRFYFDESDEDEDEVQEEEPIDMKIPVTRHFDKVVDKRNVLYTLLLKDLIKLKTTNVTFQTRTEGFVLEDEYSLHISPNTLFELKDVVLSISIITPVQQQNSTVTIRFRIEKGELSCSPPVNVIVRKTNQQLRVNKISGTDDYQHLFMSIPFDSIFGTRVQSIQDPSCTRYPELHSLNFPSIIATLQESNLTSTKGLLRERTISLEKVEFSALRNIITGKLRLDFELMECCFELSSDIELALPRARLQLAIEFDIESFQSLCGRGEGTLHIEDGFSLKSSPSTTSYAAHCAATTVSLVNTTFTSSIHNSDWTFKTDFSLHLQPDGPLIKNATTIDLPEAIGTILLSPQKPFINILEVSVAEGASISIPHLSVPVLGYQPQSIVLDCHDIKTTFDGVKASSVSGCLLPVRLIEMKSFDMRIPDQGLSLKICGNIQGRTAISFLDIPSFTLSKLPLMELQAIDSEVQIVTKSQTIDTKNVQLNLRSDESTLELTFSAGDIQVFGTKSFSLHKMKMNITNGIKFEWLEATAVIDLTTILPALKTCLGEVITKELLKCNPQGNVVSFVPTVSDLDLYTQSKNLYVKCSCNITLKIRPKLGSIVLPDIPVSIAVSKFKALLSVTVRHGQPLAGSFLQLEVRGVFLKSHFGSLDLDVPIWNDSLRPFPSLDSSLFGNLLLQDGSGLEIVDDSTLKVKVLANSR